MAEKTVKLNQEIGLLSSVCLIISVMLGSGIFICPANALKNTGSVGMCLVIWVCCGMLALCGALSYAELGTLVTKSGGEFSFYQSAFSDLHRFWGPLPSFIHSWVCTIYLRPAEVAIITLTFAEYVVQPIQLYNPYLSSDDIFRLKKIISILALGLMTYINYTSVTFFIKIQNFFTLCKVFACFVVITGGLNQLYLGNTENIMTGFQGTTLTIGTLPMAFYSGLWAYDGWTASTLVSEEVKNPEKNILRSILIAVPFVTLIYFMMNLSYLSVLSISEMTSVPAVAVMFGSRALGNFSFIIPLGVGIATFGCALTIQFSISRLCYAASREGQMLEVFSYVHVDKLTPTPSVVLQGILSLFCILSGNIIQLIEFASFLGWMFYGTSMVSLLVMRYTKKDIPRPFKVPIIIPIFVLMVSIILFLTPLIKDPKPQYLIGLGFILSAFVIYIPFVYLKKRSPIVDKFTRLVQLLMNVIPPEDDKTTVKLVKPVKRVKPDETDTKDEEFVSTTTVETITSRL